MRERSAGIAGSYKKLGQFRALTDFPGQGVFTPPDRATIFHADLIWDKLSKMFNLPMCQYANDFNSLAYWHIGKLFLFTMKLSNV